LQCIYEVKVTPADAAALQAEVERLSALLSTIKRANQLDRERILAGLTIEAGGTPEAEPVPTLQVAPTKTVTNKATAKRAKSTAEDPDESSGESHSPEDELAAAMLSELSVAASGQVEHFGASSFLVSAVSLFLTSFGLVAN
jgi:hypothetical protein